jgi:DNA-binding MarR family transcriptional regulator
MAAPAVNVEGEVRRGAGATHAPPGETVASRNLTAWRRPGQTAHMVAARNDGAGALLREVVRLHARAQREAVAAQGLTVAQCHLLTELERGGPATVTALAARLGVHKGWVSRGAAALSREGLLVRAAGRDGREVVLALDGAGRRRAEALERSLDAHAGRVLDRVPARERAAVRAALAALAAALRPAAADPRPARRSPP